MKRFNFSMMSGSLVVIVLLFVAVAVCEDLNTEKVEAELLKKAAENIEKYRKADVAVTLKTESGQSIASVQVEVTQFSHDFSFGATIFDIVAEGDLYRADLYIYQPEAWKERFKELFNFAVLPFYWNTYEKKQGMTNWQDTLAVLEWCKSNGIKPKGHPLVWTYNVPKWVRAYPADLRKELLKARVINIVSGFAGQIDMWDVVNEAVHTRVWDNPGTDDYIEEPIPKVADYVEEAFRWAYMGNPKAEFILNEYNTIANRESRKRFIELVKELMSRNTPISGLGIQAHEPREEWYPPPQLWETLDQLGSFGYPLHITEFIPQSGGKEITGGWRKGKWTLETQAEFAEQFYRLCFGHPAVVSINWWGLSDAYSWLPGGGLLTQQYEPKPVYNRLKKLIHDEWKTKVITTTDHNGAVSFRGFYGKYSIKLTKDGQVHSFDLLVSRDKENKQTFTVK